jgi:hypothetical protein
VVGSAGRARLTLLGDTDFELANRLWDLVTIVGKVSKS